MSKVGLILALVVTLSFAAAALFGYVSSEAPVVVVETPDVVIDGDYVIPPGREANVVRWLEPVAGVVAPLEVVGYSIQKSEIRVQLSGGSPATAPCSADAWVQGPGALVVTRAASTVDGVATDTAHVGRTHVASVACDPTGSVVNPAITRTLAEKLDDTYAGDIWTRAERRSTRPVAAASGGMASGFPGVGPQFLSIVTLVVALALALAIGAMAAFRERSLPSTTLSESHSRIGWVILAVGLLTRVAAAITSSFDTDESCAIPPLLDRCKVYHRA